METLLWIGGGFVVFFVLPYVFRMIRIMATSTIVTDGHGITMAAGKYIKDPVTGAKIKHGIWIIHGSLSRVLPEAEFKSSTAIQDHYPYVFAVVEALADALRNVGKESNLVTDALFKNGKAHGTWVTKGTNGTLVMEMNFRDGKLNGPFYQYGSRNEIIGVGNYKDGLLEGDLIAYDDVTGLIKTSTHYVRGLKDGKRVIYDYELGATTTTTFRADHEVEGSDDLVFGLTMRRLSGDLPSNRDIVKAPPIFNL